MRKEDDDNITAVQDDRKQKITGKFQKKSSNVFSEKIFVLRILVDKYATFKPNISGFPIEGGQGGHSKMEVIPPPCEVSPPLLVPPPSLDLVPPH